MLTIILHSWYRLTKISSFSAIILSNINDIHRRIIRYPIYLMYYIIKRIFQNLLG